MRLLSTVVGGAAGIFLMLDIGHYPLQRIQCFLDPWSDPYGAGYQLSHALIALGRGEITGVGLGDSVEKLFYLPESYTDFLLAVIGEELGLIGVFAVILCLRRQGQPVDKIADFAGLKRVHERAGIDEGAAGGVHQIRAARHSGDGSGVDHPARFVGERTVEAHDVGLREQLLQVLHATDTEGLVAAVRHVGIVERHIHAECIRAQRGG